ncbi:hypothetical protein GA0074692_1657 [Micromonospora pallida]|uniref:Uncharacterized protein n=1 Tax=Micromonospora pallida TaxID=145854 RepID=A0A1C6S342_9ACTN|nr:hypothetical protein GA0074692_1657 [Micromonospora pallida]
MAGPAIWPVARAPARAAFAPTSRSAGTSRGSTALIEMSVTPARMPEHAATTTRYGRLSTSSRYIAGTEATTSACSRSLAISSRRGERTLSMRTPTSGAVNPRAPYSRAKISAAATGPASSSSTARVGSASAVTWVPVRLMSCATTSGRSADRSGEGAVDTGHTGPPEVVDPVTR